MEGQVTSPHPLGQTNYKKKESFVRTYLSPSSGTLKFASSTRFWALGLQFVMLIISCFTACLYKFWLFDTQSRFYPFYYYFLIPLSWLGYFYWLLAFYLSVRSNVPKFVSTKNTLGLFFFTLIFFESAVLSFLLWLLYFVFSWNNTTVCPPYAFLCQGLMLGSFTILNTLLLSLGVVLMSVKKQLGIELFEACGLDK
eukprot:TRINITY_DN3840_c0_g1_i3.p1 TRINITY_DN3840_c0_g1~~TRINITY_DN3840_c0_g1_i3.p1  ORF type:complete len:197 (+),score=10.92 TRINITY_DN3840_c0_g1_i3:102-692(+)